jgi:transposase
LTSASQCRTLIRSAAQPWLSRARARLPLEVHGQVFGWVLQRLIERGLIKGERIGVDASTVEAKAALRAIVRRGAARATAIC